MALHSVYKGLKVLVTGHTGFKGSWLSVWLKTLGAEVHGIALAPKTSRDNFLAAGLEDKLNHNICDIRDSQRVMEVFNRIQPDMVFHLAAQPLVRESYENPVETYETNLMGSVHILEAVRKTPSVRTVVMITSDKCYKNVEWVWGYRETDELGGLDPYGASKSCAEIAIESFRKSFFTTPDTANIASVRAGNVIGGGDWSSNRIVPDIIRALHQGKSIVLRKPNATRPWQFVLEPLSGYLWLGAEMFSNPASHDSSWNFGPNDTTIITVKELTEMMVAAWGNGQIEAESENHDFHEATLLGLDCSKARHYLSWRPTLTVQETVEFTVFWYKEFFKRDNMYGLNVEIIEEYSAKARERGILWAQ